MVLNDPAAQLVNDARQGGQTAFESLVRPLIEQAHRLAYGMLRDHHAAEDAVQESTFKAWHRFHQFREGTSIRSWYLTIVANECRSMLRGPWWKVLRTGDLPEVPVAIESATVSSLDLERALAQLGYEHRLVLCLYYFLDLPQEDVARILGVRIGTVKSRLHRAIRSLRRHMVAPEEVL
jgi:RNA polymerase sigma-70 factor (ECF subfamily)